MTATVSSVRHSLPEWSMREELRFEEGSCLLVKSIVRVVPENRFVIFGQWQNITVYAKCFLGKRAHVHVQRDANGTAMLHAAEIPTAELLLQTTYENAHVLIYRALLPSIHLEAYFEEKHREHAQNVARLLFQLVGKMHNAGLIQHDMYLKNFLWHQGQVFALDGDGIRVNKSQHHQLRNLCLLLSKFDALALENWMPSLLKVYSQEKNVKLDVSQIAHWVRKLRLKTTSDYADKKVFRSCTDVNVLNRVPFFAISSKYAEYSSILTTIEPDKWIASGDRIKTGNTCTVSRVSVDGLEMVFKRYNIKSFMHWLSRLGRRSRALRSWSNAHRLKALGLNTPDPIAVIDFSKWGLPDKAYYVSQYIQAPDLAEYLIQNTHLEDGGAMVSSVVQLMYQMYLIGLSHGDLKATNIKVYLNQPYLIDLDSMQQHLHVKKAEAAHIKDLKRLMQNWKDHTSLYNMFVEAFISQYQDQAVLKKAGLLN